MTMNRPHYILLLCSVILGTLNGCAATSKQWHEGVSNSIDTAFSQKPAPKDQLAETKTEQGTPPVPDSITDALLAPLDQADISAKTVSEPRFDIAAENTEARALFMSLVEGTPYSMVVHPDVSGNITLKLKNVTIEEALNTIREIYGYDFRRQGMRFMVLGKGMQTRLYPVSYLNFKRQGLSDIHVSSGELSQNRNTTNNSGTSTAAATAQRGGINVETRSESDFWPGLTRALETLIGNEDGRRVVVNPQAGLVLIRALPSELDTVARFINLTQTTVNRQVMLEAKIIEVELNDGFQSGINWAALGNVDNTQLLASQVGGGTLLSGNNTSNLNGLSGNLDPGPGYSALDSAATTAFGGIFSLAIKGGDFAAFVEMLRSQGDVQVLSSPRVSTVNNQKAVIKVGGDEFFVTGVSNNQIVNGGTTTVSPEIELTPFFSGIALDVTPHIDDQSNIIMHIHPTVSNVDQRDKNFIVSGESFTLPLAFSNIQESDNVVRAQTGQVIIIGGLMKEATTENNASVPLLGDIPLLGNLFRHKKLTRIKKELVILLKPSVINVNGDWEESISDSHQRTRDLLFNTRHIGER